jgi:cyclophilin family peptidyl-prolyl cis-trans isomerase
MEKSTLFTIGGLVVLAVGAIVLLVTMNTDTESPTEKGDNQGNANNVEMITLKTNFGDIQFETFKNAAPKTVENFITLARKGFYNNLTFHRVIKGFMIQGGDPNGDGSGGPGYTFKDEIDPASALYQQGYKKGIVAMANRGPDTNGSQFFIMLEDTPLPPQYTIFGKVTKGQEVVDAIGKVETNETDRPLEPVIIKSIEIEAS